MDPGGKSGGPEWATRDFNNLSDPAYETLILILFSVVLIEIIVIRCILIRLCD